MNINIILNTAPHQKLAVRLAYSHTRCREITREVKSKMNPQVHWLLTVLPPYIQRVMTQYCRRYTFTWKKTQVTERGETKKLRKVESQGATFIKCNPFHSTVVSHSRAQHTLYSHHTLLHKDDNTTGSCTPQPRAMNSKQSDPHGDTLGKELMAMY